MTKYIKPLIVYTLAASILSGCGAMQAATEEKLPVLPQTFGSSSDSATVADIAWRTFFTDTNLVRLIDAAVENNQDVKTALQRVVMARADIRASKGALLPNIDAILSAGADKYGDYTMNGVGNYDTNLSPNIDKDQHIPTSPTTDVFLGLRSAWEVDIWGKLKSKKNNTKLFKNI